MPRSTNPFDTIFIEEFNSTLRHMPRPSEFDVLEDVLEVELPQVDYSQLTRDRQNVLSQIQAENAAPALGSSEGISECYVCDRFYKDSEIRTIDGKKICFSCVEKAKKCTDCNHYIQRYAQFTHRSKYYCQGCFFKKYFSCYYCHIGENLSKGHSEGDKNMCNKCFKLNYSRCDNCKATIENTSRMQCEVCKALYCSKCDCKCRIIPIPDINNDFIRQAIVGKPIAAMPFKDLVGVEIEGFTDSLNSVDMTLDRHIAYLGDDGSIDNQGEDGFEIRTMPASGDKLIEVIGKTTTILNTNNCKVNSSCGLHVHIDCRSIVRKPRKLSQLMMTYFAFEDVLYSMLPSQRWENSYCRPLHYDYDFDEMFAKTSNGFRKKWYGQNMRVSYTVGHGGNSRYHSFNMDSVFYRGSLEVRAHSGTTNPEKIISWIYILLTMKNWAMNNYDRDFIKKMSNRSVNKTKVNIFLRTFKFDKELKDYILARIKKFNPNSLQPRKQNFWKTQFDLYKTDDSINWFETQIRETYGRMASELYDCYKKDTKTFKEIFLTQPVIKKWQKELKKLNTVKGILMKKQVERKQEIPNYQGGDY